MKKLANNFLPENDPEALEKVLNDLGKGSFKQQRIGHMIAMQHGVEDQYDLLDNAKGLPG